MLSIIKKLECSHISEFLMTFEKNIYRVKFWRKVLARLKKSVSVFFWVGLDTTLDTPLRHK